MAVDLKDFSPKRAKKFVQDLQCETLDISSTVPVREKGLYIFKANLFKCSPFLKAVLRAT